MALRLLENGIELVNPWQKVAFQRHGDDQRLHMSTYVRSGDSWEKLFGDAGPLVRGSAFDLVPTHHDEPSVEAGRAEVLLRGRHAQPDYDWDLLVEADDDSPWIRLRLTCHLTEPLTIGAPQPTTAFWKRGDRIELAVDQGPMSIYGGATWGNSFPAAYLWDAGKEAIVFFCMEPMQWMSRSNLRRFIDCRVAARVRAGEVGLGMHALTRSGDTIPAGKLVVELCLWQQARPGKPTTRAALDTTIDACAQLLPASAPFPENRVPPYRTTWRTFADGVARDLMLKEICWTDLESSWRDEPLFSDDRLPHLRVHSDYAINSSEVRSAKPEAKDIHDGEDSSPFNRSTVLQVWDNATCNAFLAAWMIYQRVHPDEAQHELLLGKIASVPAFYDRDARLFRWHAEGVALSQGQASTMANGVEMSWENFLFTLDPLRVHQACAPDEFTPAIAGRFLMACQGLIEYAHRVQYLFPQWFDAYHKTETMQLDIPALGKVREPFQAGTYAWLMLAAHDMTGEARYLDEAKSALDTVLNRVDYTVVNRRYTVHIADAVEAPIAETFGNGYAVAAAQKIHRLTGDQSWADYARDFANILLRMAFWYDDQSDAVSRDLNNLGLFRAHGGHFGSCPWENIEAYLPLIYHLREADEPREVLLKMLNLQRATAFYYFGPVWTDLVAAPNPRLYFHECQYLPIENFYTLEFGGSHGSMGRCIYMCSIAFWNYLLYEAFGRCDDRDVMALNLDLMEHLDDALSAAERQFVLYNPTTYTKRAMFSCHALAPGEYVVGVRRRAGAPIGTRYADEDLARGFPLELTAGESVRVTVRHRDAEEMKGAAAQRRAAQSRIAHAYQVLQEYARDEGIDAFISDCKRGYQQALEAYRTGSDAEAEELAALVTRDTIARRSS